MLATCGQNSLTFCFFVAAVEELPSSCLRLLDLDREWLSSSESDEWGCRGEGEGGGKGRRGRARGKGREGRKAREGREGVGEANLNYFSFRYNLDQPPTSKPKGMNF